MVKESVLVSILPELSTLIPSFPEFVITEFPFSLAAIPEILIPCSPEFVIFKVPLFSLTTPLLVISIPSPVLFNVKFPFWFSTLPEILIEPFELSIFKFPLELEIFPETSTPFEPVLMILTSPLPKFFISPAIFVPPFSP